MQYPDCNRNSYGWDLICDECCEFLVEMMPESPDVDLQLQGRDFLIDKLIESTALDQNIQPTDATVILLQSPYDGTGQNPRALQSQQAMHNQLHEQLQQESAARFQGINDVGQSTHNRHQRMTAQKSKGIKAQGLLHIRNYYKWMRSNNIPPYLNKFDLDMIAKKYGLDRTTILKWFSNKRYNDKKRG